MLSANEVSTPRLETPPATATATAGNSAPAAATTERGPVSLAAARPLLVRLGACGVYLALMARLGAAGAVQWVTALLVVAIPLARPARPALGRWLEGALPFALFLAAYDALGLARDAHW